MKRDSKEFCRLWFERITWCSIEVEWFFHSVDFIPHFRTNPTCLPSCSVEIIPKLSAAASSTATVDQRRQNIAPISHHFFSRVDFRVDFWRRVWTESPRKPFRIYWPMCCMNSISLLPSAIDRRYAFCFPIFRITRMIINIYSDLAISDQ